MRKTDWHFRVEKVTDGYIGVCEELDLHTGVCSSESEALRRVNDLADKVISYEDRFMEDEYDL